MVSANLDWTSGGSHFYAVIASMIFMQVFLPLFAALFSRCSATMLRFGKVK